MSWRWPIRKSSRRFRSWCRNNNEPVSRQSGIMRFCRDNTPTFSDNYYERGFHERELQIVSGWISDMDVAVGFRFCRISGCPWTWCSQRQGQKSGSDYIIEMETGAGRKKLQDFCVGFGRYPEKSGAGRSMQRLFRGWKIRYSDLSDPPKTFQKGYSVFLDCSSSQRYRRRTYCYYSLIYNGIDIFHGHGLMTGIRSHN